MSLRKPDLWFGLITLAAVALNLWLRLSPFHFAWDGRIPWERLSLAPLTLRDVPVNILLFAPLGFGLAGLLARGATADERPLTAEGRQASESRLGQTDPGRQPVAGQPPAVVPVLLLSLLFSAALEGAQLFMRERVPSLADVVANGLGALLGYGLYRAWAMGFGRALRRYATGRALLIGLVLYVLGIALLTAYLYQSVRLGNWDTAFPLVVGNEAVGRRQWSGRVESLELVGGLIDSPDHVARFDLDGTAPFAGGQSVPPLVWREGPATSQSGAGVTVGPGEWLATSTAFSGFSDTARRYGAFAIRTVVATADTRQRGPARIVSVSADAEHRNITLGQEKDALIIRLRTPASGENGQKPEVLVLGVFSGSQQRHLDVSYEAPMLRVRVDGVEEYTLSLAPGLAFFPDFANENRYPVTMSEDAHGYDRRYWTLVVGVATLLFGLPASLRWGQKRRSHGGHGSTR